MIGENWPGINVLLGLGEETLLLWQIGMRTFVVYLAVIALVRLGEKRFLGKYAALAVILGFVLGSILSGAITGSSAFFETLGATLVLVLLHWLFAVLAFHSDRPFTEKFLPGMLCQEQFAGTWGMFCGIRDRGSTIC